MSIFDFFFGKPEKGVKDVVEKNEPKPTVPVQQPLVKVTVPTLETADHAGEPTKAMEKTPNIIRGGNYPKNSKANWPQYGADPSVLFNNRQIKVIAEADIMCTKGFLTFAQVWHTCNQSCKTKRLIFVPDFEYNIVPTKILISLHALLPDKELTSLQFGAKDYESLFSHQSVQGPVVFLSGSIDKAKKVKSIAFTACKELRYFTLDDEGRLSNFTDTPQNYSTKITIPIEDRFLVAATITPSHVAKNPLKSPIIKGALVYDDQGNAVKLIQEFMSNATSITYRTDRLGIFAKIYVPDVLRTSYFEDKTCLMLQKIINRKGIGWPISMLHDASGCFIGSLIPEADGIPLMQSVLGEEQLKRYFPSWNKKDLCDLTICILNHIIFLQDRNIFFGCINPQSIFVKDKNHVYFVDMDCYQIEGYPCTSQNITFQPPELQLSGIYKRLYTQETENYEIAELVFMLLMPGKTPYAKEKNADMAQSIANMKFPFSWSGQPGNKEIDRPSGRWRFVWSHLGHLKGDFYNTFMRGKPYNAPEKRKNAYFWLNEVNKLRRQLENPYDPESLQLFPKTFKRDAKTRFYKCQYCGVEYPEFYFYHKYFNTPYRICNSCLNTKSEKSFNCISTYHVGTDRKFFYSQKMAIFHQLATAQNPDWHKQKYCRECKHIRIQIYKELRCVNCGHTFHFTFGQKEDYDNRFGIDSWSFPKYCQECQKNKKRH